MWDSYVFICIFGVFLNTWNKLGHDTSELSCIQFLVIVFTCIVVVDPVNAANSWSVARGVLCIFHIWLEAIVQREFSYSVWLHQLLMKIKNILFSDGRNNNVVLYYTLQFWALVSIYCWRFSSLFATVNSCGNLMQRQLKKIKQRRLF